MLVMSYHIQAFDTRLMLLRNWVCCLHRHLSTGISRGCAIDCAGRSALAAPCGPAASLAISAHRDQDLLAEEGQEGGCTLLTRISAASLGCATLLAGAINTSCPYEAASPAESLSTGCRPSSRQGSTKRGSRQNRTIRSRQYVFNTTLSFLLGDLLPDVMEWVVVIVDVRGRVVVGLQGWSRSMPVVLILNVYIRRTLD